MQALSIYNGTTQTNKARAMTRDIPANDEPLKSTKGMTYGEWAEKGQEAFARFLKAHDKTFGTHEDAMAFVLSPHGLKFYGDLPGITLSDIALLLALRS